MSAAILIRSGFYPQPDAVHAILEVVKQRQSRPLAGEVVQDVGLFNIREPEAIDFVKAALADRDPEFRRTALHAVQHMSVDTRSSFIAELERVAADPKEKAETRSLAAKLSRR